MFRFVWIGLLFLLSSGFTGPQNWSLSGMIAARTSNNAWSASIQWRQQGSQYQIALFGPLGTQAVNLFGMNGFAELNTADGKRFVSSSPEELLASQTGWRLPVSNLYFWIRGMPVPQARSAAQYDAAHHLIALDQNGWSVRYLNYMHIGNYYLPARIFLYHPALNVKILINQWQI